MAWHRRIKSGETHPMHNQLVDYVIIAGSKSITVPAHIRQSKKGLPTCVR